MCFGPMIDELFRNFTKSRDTHRVCIFSRNTVSSAGKTKSLLRNQHNLGIIPYVDFDWSPHFEPRCASRYPIISLSPIRHPSVMQHENFSTKEIVTDLFERTNILSANLPVFFTKKPLFSAISVSSSDTKVRQYQRGTQPQLLNNSCWFQIQRACFFADNGATCAQVTLEAILVMAEAEA